MKKRFIIYFTWSLFVLILLYIHSFIKPLLEERFYETLDIRPYILFIWLYPILIGILIRLPKLISDILNANGKPQIIIDWIQLAAVGLPLFIVSAVPLYELTSLIPADFAVQFIGVTYIAGVIFGYSLIFSIKVNKKK